MFPKMFNGYIADTIVNVGNSDFAIGTILEGLHVVDMEQRIDKAHFFEGKSVIGIALVENGLILVGVDNELHLVDIKYKATRKVANAGDWIYSIQLLSKKHSLALTLLRNE